MLTQTNEQFMPDFGVFKATSITLVMIPSVSLTCKPYEGGVLIVVADCAIFKILTCQLPDGQVDSLKFC